MVNLQPIVKEILWNIQHTTNFLRKINSIGFVLDNSCLVSIDVKLLYINIPSAEGIKSVKTSFENCPKRTDWMEVIIIFLALMLTFRQLYFQLQKLLADKRLRHGNNLCTLIGKNLYGSLRKKIHIFIYQDIFTYVPQVYRRYIFHTDRQ